MTRTLFVLVKLATAALLVAALFLSAQAKQSSVSSVSSRSRSPNKSKKFALLLVPRGGATGDGESDEDSYFEDDDDEVADSVLVKSTVKSLDKSQAKATKKTKAEIRGKLSESKPTPKKESSSKKNLVPYIIRACMNPSTVLKMTKAYFASLFNLDFLKEEPAQNLRSSLEEKARRGGTGSASNNKGKRRMKPGRSKSLSDLPQLNT